MTITKTATKKLDHGIIRIKGSRFSLEREGDGAGDSGGMLQPFCRKTIKPVGENGEIIVGYSLMCGSTYARSYQHQDWWLTTSVEEILERNEDDSVVRVRTKNSVYTIKGF